MEINIKDALDANVKVDVIYFKKIFILLVIGFRV
jgi:hypothetical protein